MTSIHADVQASSLVAPTLAETGCAGIADCVDRLCAEAYEAGLDAAAVILSRMAELLRALQPATAATEEAI